MLDRARPEHAADDGRPLEQGLRLGCKVVDARRDERLQSVRDPSRLAVAAALDEHPYGLFDEERVPLGALEHLARKLGRSLTRRACELAEQLLDEQLALVLGERLELDRRRADAPSAPPRTVVQELGPCETH